GPLTANGGGGGAPTGGNNGVRGSQATANPALGGVYSGGPGPTRRGGAGGAGSTVPGIGENYTYNDGLGTATSLTSRGSGGGGAVGRIEVKRRVGGVAGLASPPATITDAVFE
nr:hypothetical protein [Deltaproteobacteria bacterium]